MGLTSTERSRARRERLRQAPTPPPPDPALAAILAALDALPARVAQAVAVAIRDATGATPSTNGRNGTDATLRNERNGGGRPRARTYARGEPHPPTGVVEAPAPQRATDYTDDDQRALVALVAPGSTASVQDATGLPRDRAVGALVRLQVRGLVERHPGDGLYPDTWARTTQGPVPDLEPLAAVPLVLDLEPPTFRVECQDYRAHGTAHRWDPALGAFRCERCNPQAEGGSPPAPPPAAPRQDLAPVTVTQ